MRLLCCARGHAQPVQEDEFCLVTQPIRAVVSNSWFLTDSTAASEHGFLSVERNRASSQAERRKPRVEVLIAATDEAETVGSDASGVQLAPAAAATQTEEIEMVNEAAASSATFSATLPKQPEFAIGSDSCEATTFLLTHCAQRL